MQQSKINKNNRILDIYLRLNEGKTINKTEDARYYGVNERSIQRDIDDIRAYLSAQSSEGKGNRDIVYDRMKKGFVMTGEIPSLMTNSEILAVSKILLESRAFSKEEMNGILDKLISGCVPEKNMKLVIDLLSNERHHYVELGKKPRNMDKLWDMGVAIRGKQLLSLTYHRQQDKEGKVVQRYVEPLSIIFSEYYFYLIGYIVDWENKTDTITLRHDYPAVFRIDRIDSYELLERNFKVQYGNRFEEGEFRKRVQFMYPGELTWIEIRYTGTSVEAVLDRLPSARITRQERDTYYIEAEVYGTGILMWLLSQGDRVEVLRPGSLRNEMRQKLLQILDKYIDNN